MNRTLFLEECGDRNVGNVSLNRRLSEIQYDATFIFICTRKKVSKLDKLYATRSKVGVQSERKKTSIQSTSKGKIEQKRVSNTSARSVENSLFSIREVYYQFSTSLIDADSPAEIVLSFQMRLYKMNR